jgi:hypothetical protein
VIRVANKRTWKGEGHYVGRPTALGNPFSHLAGTLAKFKVASRDEAVDRYREWLEERLGSDNPETRMFVSLLEEYERCGELTLVCFCVPERCHAEIIKEFIEECAV